MGGARPYPPLCVAKHQQSYLRHLRQCVPRSVLILGQRIAGFCTLLHGIERRSANDPVIEPFVLGRCEQAKKC